MSFIERVCQALMVVNLYGKAPWNNNNKNLKVITNFFNVFSYIANRFRNLAYITHSCIIDQVILYDTII